MSASKIEYIRPKLRINRYKSKPPHILFRKIAREIDHETQKKLNVSVDHDLSLWLIRLISLNPKYGIGSKRLFNRAVFSALIEDYLRMVSGSWASYAHGKFSNSTESLLAYFCNSFFVYLHALIPTTTH